LVLLLVGALMVARGRSDHREEHHAGPMDRVLEFAKQKPLIAGAAALAASFVVLRNPGMLATLIMGLMAPRPGRGR
jgi:hypothetical protein